jgi:hypothetical protein
MKETRDMTNTTLQTVITAHPDMTDTRRETLAVASDMGADAATLETIASATRVSRTTTIYLPPFRPEGLSRGHGGCRHGRGVSAIWAERTDRGYVVERKGMWSVGATDGFNRRAGRSWVVSHVTVGSEIWTVAS